MGESNILAQPLLQLRDVLIMHHGKATVWEVGLDPREECADAFLVICDSACGKLVIETVDKGWNQAIREYLALNDHTPLDVELNVDQSPIKLVLETVSELGCFSETPLPFRVTLVQSHQLWDLFKALLTKHILVDGQVRPLLGKLLLKRLTEVRVVDFRAHFL